MMRDSLKTCAPRILLVSAGFYPPDFAGGQLRVHKTFLRLRERCAFVVNVLALSGKLTAAGWSNVDGIRVLRLADNRGLVSQIVAVGRHLMREKRAGVNVVYTLTTGRLVYITGLWARLFRLPVVAEFINANLADSGPRKAMVRFLAHSARLNIAISQPVARQLRALGVSERCIWVRPNPVDVATFAMPTAAARADARRKLHIDDAQLLHIVIGSVEARKNQNLTVAAMERLPSNHCLVIVGPVLPQNESYAESLRQKITASPARTRIHLVDRFVDNVETYMYAADCLWMPSKEEGLGNVMLEAMCCGVPCIINRELGMDEHITDMINGVQAETTAQEWADAAMAILPIAQDIKARSEISRAAQAKYNAASFDARFFAHITAVAAGEKMAGAVRPPG